jgi:hypothetical protein
MIDLKELVSSGKIDQADANIYTLFELSEMGRNWLSYMQHQTFLSAPDPVTGRYDPSIIAYLDGRRSVVRDIMKTIGMVKERMFTE